jgi:thiamine biosynthesis lipoprotein
MRLNNLRLTRRRTLFIGATLLGSALVRNVSAAPDPVARWSGQALGAHATIVLVGLDDAEARPLFDAIELELDRLEAIFSLYRPASAISVLNRDSVLHAPPPEFLEVMTIAAAVNRRTFGLFDPSVQPLFTLYAGHYAAGNSSQPSAEALASALSCVGFSKVSVASDSVRFTAPGMALTLNGIAQGYITDRVAGLLRAAGMTNVLLDMGEIRAMGAGHSGDGWHVGLRANPHDASVSRALTLSEGAVATSMMLGTTLDPGGTLGHILHPRRGLTASYNQRVTVVSDTAAQADALSTAAVLMDTEQLDRLVGEGVKLYV